MRENQVTVRIIYQEPGKRFSKWMQIPGTVHLSCCDCGLTHTIQFAANTKGKLCWRLSRSKKRTEKRRKMARVQRAIKRLSK